MPASDPSRMPGRMRRRGGGVGLSLLLVSLAVVAAGCGGGSKAPGVASLGPTPSPGKSHGSAARGSTAAHVEAFSTCMRTHGVPSFPGPNSQGSISVGSGSGIDANSTQFRAAAKACAGLLPTPSPAQQQVIQTALLHLAVCMRAHGVPDFPDPSLSGGRPPVKTASLGGIDPNSPQFQSAETTCISKLSKLVAGATGISIRIGGGATSGDHQSSVSVGIPG